MNPRPLHERFSQLAAKLPHVTLAALPTPLADWPLGEDTLLAKLDGGTSPLYGGNKVRKLEYVLAQAKAHGCTRVATFGAAGSNHATATAVHAHALGLRCTTFLSHQTQTPWVADNLWRQLVIGTDMVCVEGTSAQQAQQARAWLARCADARVWRVPMGGSSLAGSLGYVNAGLELAEQLATAAGVAQAPDRIYVPLGTMGTAVGLAVGLALAGLRVPVHAVRVVDQSVASAHAAARFHTHTVRLLRALDPTVPKLPFDPALLVVRDAFFGDGYAHPTEAARTAVELGTRSWRATLETTYSGKALAALLADRRARNAPRRPLFWCTYSDHNSRVTPQPELLENLPAPLRRYL